MSDQLERRRRFWLQLRVLAVSVALLVGLLAVAKGTWELGVTRREELNVEAEKRFRRRLALSARRGAITDRHGEDLAVEVKVDSVFADPRKIKDPSTAAFELASVMGGDPSALSQRLSSKKHFVWLKRKVEPGLAERIHKLGIEGIGLIKENKRYYPGKQMAAQLIGFTGVDSGGLEGLELKFEKQLRFGENAERVSEKGELNIGVGEILDLKDFEGYTVELTLDRTLQHIAETELEATVRTVDARAGHVVIMDPHTGEILAMVNWPSYNLNAYSESTAEQRRNRTVLDVYEPGSTFKVFTLAAALNSNSIRPDELTFCERGQMLFHDIKIHDDHRDGWLNPTQCLKRSSNICFAKMALKVGKRRFYHYLRRFGFGARTDLPVPKEASGVLHHYQKWYDIDLATVAFGQGIGVTALQMATAVSSIANGGVLMKPLLVRRLIDAAGETVQSFAPQPRRRVISRYTARLVSDMMTAVTEEGGTGVQAALPGFLVAGKTGTAQKSVGRGGYQEDKWVASFVGFVPSDNPRLVISVTVDEPMINHYGGTVAAPVMRRIADQATKYLGISPNRFRYARRAEPKGALQAEKTDAQEFDAEGDEALEELLPPLGPGQVRMPDLSGKSMVLALSALSKLGLRPLFDGSGFVADQNPAPGFPVDRGAFVQVKFSP